MKFVRFLAWWAVFLGTALAGSVAGEGGNSKEPPVNPDPQQLVWIKPGTFTMGSPSTEKERYSCEGPQTQVTLSQGFWMSKYETTQEEYLAVMGSNPADFTGNMKRPEEQVSWDDATNYCAKLTDRERTSGRLPSGYAYRLPTEAEWEYACRAGTTTATAYGDSLSSTQANFNGSSPYNGNAEGPYLGKTIMVGSYAPNAWGLYDMHGNVWEWCLDWAGTYPGGSETDPRGTTTGSIRVLRGGCWYDYGWYCRSAFRFGRKPDIRNGYVGFRPVLAPVQ
jgi:formylglycine-generating enzyme required for sulfatase activity